ncbi:Uncharacterized protein Adt_42578 [Abeliophyllum distichum]|uniref:Uncharacterized protein n=1 Tax=Abeliophyllum distichum TaxID=126358 RepID=A0ABD1PS26_9LAMI
MADVMSHGGDGVGDPPQHPSHRLASACESGNNFRSNSPPPKRRGISRGINLEIVWQANGKMPLPIVSKHNPIGSNAKYFTRLVGNQVRFIMPPCYPSWTEVPEEHYFNLQGDRSPDEYCVVFAAVDRLAADCYRDYKLKAHNHLKAHGPSRPFGEMSAEDWQKCIDFFTSPTFVDKLVELRETQHTQVASSGASLNERAIAKEVLGERRGTSHQFSGDSQNNDPRFAMYEAQLRQMQHEIEILKNRIPVVVPVEEENGDGDEGLEGP